MIKKKKKVQCVLVYLDSAVFGGHEVTLLESIKALAQEPKISLLLLLPQDNKQLLNRLNKLKLDVKIKEHAFKTAPGDVFRVLFKTKKVRQLQKKISKQQPDLVIVSQGAVALSACGLGAARSAKIPLMSFLPMAHPATLVRGKSSILVRLQDLLYNRLYALPDYFFTICNTAKEQLQQLHGVDPSCIFVHYFGLDIDRSKQANLPRKRKDKGVKHLALIGRIEFQQKRHDFLIEQLALYKKELPPLVVHIIGDGPDREKLWQLVQALDIEPMIRFEGWVDDLGPWYEMLDAVLLPSRFEGVPVVMLEAMHRGIPVIASDLDGMAEMLPKAWRFPVNDGRRMIQCMQDILNNEQTDRLLQNRQFVDTLDTASFRTGFCNAVFRCLETKQQQKKNP